eukprot:GGOE01002140.1.p2 GENE.GGOE01002140.1~~GGOE01002140.1.p2  ORF type:complete len:488 (-),score=154.35 GGOE01002140.1:410-1741(-)
MAPCQHICCPACLEGWKTCPQCGVSIHPGEFSSPGRIIENLYGKLEMLCEFKGRSCDVRFPFANVSEMEEHVAQCPKAPCCCPNDGCAYTALRELMPEHEPQCEHRLIYCDLCSMAVKVNAVATHKTAVCPAAEIECSCGQKLRRADKEQHSLRTCPHRIPIMCPVIGCGRSVPQGELEAHVNSALVMHLQLMSVAMQERDSTLQRLTDEVQRTQKKLTEAEEKITALEAGQRDLSWYGMGLWRGEADGRNVWTIGNMNQKLKEASLKQHAGVQGQLYIPMLFWSPQHYTHPTGGYRFSLRVDLGSSLNVGLFVHLHEGDYDEQLPWPFNLDYTVQLGSIVSQITQRDSYMHYTSQGRPPHELSWGWANFCSVDSFKEAIQQDSVEISIWFHNSSVSGGPMVQQYQPHGTATASQNAYPRKPSNPHGQAPHALPGYGTVAPTY